MEIEFNNLYTLDTQQTGWFIGFSEWTKADVHGSLNLRHMPKDLGSHALTMKWGVHQKGSALGIGKPKSEGRTISILVSEAGRFRLQFSPCGDFTKKDMVEHVLGKHGDFVIWGGEIYHQWFVEEDCVILTVRWITEENMA